MFLERINIDQFLLVRITLKLNHRIAYYLYEKISEKDSSYKINKTYFFQSKFACEVIFIDMLRQNHQINLIQTSLIFCRS